MKTMKIGVLAVALLLLIASCTTVSFQGMQMTKDVPSFNVVGEFEKKVAHNGVIGAPAGYKLIQLNDNDERIFSIITDEIQKKGGDAAIDVTIEYKADFLDIILNAVTFSIYSPSDIIIKGTIIKYTN